MAGTRVKENVTEYFLYLASGVGFNEKQYMLEKTLSKEIAKGAFKKMSFI